MSITVTCPACGQRGNYASSAEGTRVPCVKCGKAVLVEESIEVIDEGKSGGPGQTRAGPPRPRAVVDESAIRPAVGADFLKDLDGVAPEAPSADLSAAGRTGQYGRSATRGPRQRTVVGGAAVKAAPAKKGEVKHARELLGSVPLAMDYGIPLGDAPRGKRSRSIPPPLGNTADALLPWGVILAYLGLVAYRVTAAAGEVSRQTAADHLIYPLWKYFAVHGLLQLAVFFVIAPLMLAGVWGASMIMKFNLPGMNLFRTWAILCGGLLVAILMCVGDDGPAKLAATQSLGGSSIPLVIVTLVVAAPLVRLFYLLNIVDSGMALASGAVAFGLALLLAVPLWSYSASNFELLVSQAPRNTPAVAVATPAAPVDAGSAGVAPTPQATATSPGANAAPAQVAIVKPVTPVMPANPVPTTGGGVPMVAAGGRINTVTAINGVDAVVVPQSPLPVAVLVTAGLPGQDDQIRLWDVNKWESKMDLVLPHGDRPGSYAMSPKGDVLLHVLHTTRWTAQLYAFAPRKVVKTIYLNDNFGDPTVLGYLGDEQMVIKWKKTPRMMVPGMGFGTQGTALSGGRPVGPMTQVVTGPAMYGLEVWNIKTAGVTSRMELNDFNDAAYALSPDGKTIALVETAGANARVALYGPQPKMPAAGYKAVPTQTFDLTEGNPVGEPGGLCFSPDGKQMAALLRQGGYRVVAWDLAGKQLMFDVTQPEQLVRSTGLPAQQAPSISWFDGARHLLVGGEAVLDGATGKALGRLGSKAAFAGISTGDNKVLLDMTDPFTMKQRVVGAGIDATLLPPPATMPVGPP